MAFVPFGSNLRNPRNPPPFYDPFPMDMCNPCCEFNGGAMFPPPPHFPFHHTPLPHFPFHNNMMSHGGHFPFHDSMMSHPRGSEWRETPDAHLVTVELPGFKKEDVKVKVEDGGRVLEIRGEKEKEKDEKHENWRHFERSNGAFFKTFSLPENCKADHVKTSMEHGLLTVTIPKRNVHKLSHESHHGHKVDDHHPHKISESHHGHNYDHGGHKMSESHHGHNYDHGGHKMSESHHGHNYDHGTKLSESHHGHKLSESHGHMNHDSHTRKFDFNKAISESHGSMNNHDSHTRKFDFNKILSESHGSKVDIKD